MADEKELLLVGQRLEEKLILGESLQSPLDELDATIKENFELLIKGEYEKVLTSEAGKSLGIFDFADEDVLQEKLSQWLGIASELKTQQTRQLHILLVGVAAFYAFLQENWTGPPVSDTLRALAVDRHKRLLDGLTIDGEFPYAKMVCPQWFCAARVLLLRNASSLSRCWSASWWAARVLIVHQRCLDNRAATLRGGIEDRLTAAGRLVAARPSPALLARFQLERALIATAYGHGVQAAEMLTAAQTTSGLRVDLTGVMGKRTKFQDAPVAQLVVRATTAQSATPSTTERTPTEVPLNDTDLLERPALASDADTQSLSVQDQCILLAVCQNVRANTARDEMRTEELMAFVNRVQKHPANWMVYSTCLLNKSRLESEKYRTAERAALQLQQLVEQFTDTDSAVAERMKWIFSIEFPPRWDLKKEVGEAFLRLGVAATAQKIFEELEMWEQVVTCYRVMDKVRQAEELVRARLAEAPTPDLWTALGELTNEVSCYETAWNLSKQRFGRAQRLWGFTLLRQGKWAECIPHLELALALNPLYHSAWFGLGSAALRTEDWERAQRAFGRVVQLEPDDAEAWANLASVCIRLKKKEQAFYALQEGLKHGYDNWKMWENYLYVSMDVGQLQYSLQSIVRLLELRGGDKLDYQLLGMLCDAIKNEDKKSSLYRSLADTLQKIAEKHSSAEFWNVYAVFLIAAGEKEKAYETRLKQFRAAQLPGWESDKKLFDAVVNAAELLTQAVLAEGNPKNVYSVHLSLRSVVKKTQEVFGSSAEHQRLVLACDSLKK